MYDILSSIGEIMILSFLLVACGPSYDCSARDVICGGAGTNSGSSLGADSSDSSGSTNNPDAEPSDEPSNQPSSEPNNEPSGDPTQDDIMWSAGEYETSSTVESDSCGFIETSSVTVTESGSVSDIYVNWYDFEISLPFEECSMQGDGSFYCTQTFSDGTYSWSNYIEGSYTGEGFSAFLSIDVLDTCATEISLFF